MKSYDKSNKNYIDYKGKFFDKAVEALTDEDGYRKQSYDDFFHFNHGEPTQELIDLYYNENYKYIEDKLEYLRNHL
ncbi:hypothetical protein SAMN05192566_0747 [Methylophilus rhizosphaerae]|uniref:Uncharacterized protein n=1 Tax=Methylophilus rhizosphaerae TaxID=492660 RepID=A0A1G9A8H1_9PROT|nr:hypothetical protein [Methylophilus rhizosphaerae]SDK23639.1 hypothetical protein SAMN05192566_0747 [Methylophilus rhizosphaerae]